MRVSIPTFPAKEEPNLDPSSSAERRQKKKNENDEKNDDNEDEDDDILHSGEYDGQKDCDPNSLAATALHLMSQDWTELGMGDDPQVAVLPGTTTLDDLVHRVTALLCVRLVAWLQPWGTFPDLSTTTVCRQILVQNSEREEGDNREESEGEGANGDHSISSWPAALTPQVLAQLRSYVWEILSGYHDSVPYHNVQHAYHVIVSTCKLLDMILLPKDSNGNIDENGWAEPDPSTAATPSHANTSHDFNYYDYAQNTTYQQINGDVQADPRRPPTYGLRDDPLMQLALVFAAIIHDVEHQGIPNRQLALEDDELALRYNDTSIAENVSLHIAFSLLLSGKGTSDFGQLLKVMFPVPEDYRRFRKAVINLVLTTDIASPERTQVGKSKWKEAFGDPYETVERKVLKHMERRLSKTNNNNTPDPKVSTAPTQRKLNRRLSTHSIMSELTLESRVPLDEPVLAATDSLSLHAGLSSELEDDESGSDTPESSEAAEEEYPRPQFVPLATPPEESRVQFSVKRGGARLDDFLRERSRSPAAAAAPMRRRKDGGGGSSAPTNHQRPMRTHSLDVSLHSTGAMSCLAPSASTLAAKFHRRLSSIGGNQKTTAASRRNQRLGLLRTVDLTGESIETYTATTSLFRQSATGATTTSTASTIHHRSFDDNQDMVYNNHHQSLIPEDIDELRETVVMETILKAADVAHNLQGWDVMVKFSNRLFLELRKAYVHGRGDMNPQNGWFTNQIGFLEAYLLPLARKLDDTGVFGDELGGKFAQYVETNRDRWTREGMQLTANIIMQGEREYPEEEDEEEEEY